MGGSSPSRCRGVGALMSGRLRAGPGHRGRPAGARPASRAFGPGCLDQRRGDVAASAHRCRGGERGDGERGGKGAGDVHRPRRARRRAWATGSRPRHAPGVRSRAAGCTRRAAPTASVPAIANEMTNQPVSSEAPEDCDGGQRLGLAIRRVRDRRDGSSTLESPLPSGDRGSGGRARERGAAGQNAHALPMHPPGQDGVGPTDAPRPEQARAGGGSPRSHLGGCESEPIVGADLLFAISSRSGVGRRRGDRSTPPETCRRPCES
jgi:hypothetical protein